MNNLVKASAIRALWTVFEVVVATIGADATSLCDVNWKYVLSACVLGFIITFCKCMITGLPEVDYLEHLHMSHDEPSDAEVTDDDK